MRSPAPFVSAALAAAVGAMAYPALRVGSAIVVPETDPALVVWVTRNAYAGRFLLCAYIAALVWPAAYRWARLRPDAAARALTPVLALAFVALSLQLALVP